jgi:hypothetical protein
MRNDLYPSSTLFCYFLSREFTHQKSNLTVEPEDVEATLDQLIYGKEMLSKILGISASKKPLWIGK